jgi:hypothetical protein
MILDWIKKVDRFPSVSDRALRGLLSLIGLDPDSDFIGLAPVHNIVAYDAPTDGTSDCATAFVAANIAALTGGEIHVPAGTWTIQSNITITAPIKFSDGAKLRPASGVTVTIASHLEARPSKIFDLSLGGVVRPTGPVKEFFPEWWGADPTGLTDSASAFQKMFDALPDYSKVRILLFAKYLWASPVTWTNREGIWLTSEMRPAYGNVGLPQITWSGADGGRMLFIDHCRGCTVSGLGFNAGAGAAGTGADCCIDCDGYVSGQIGSINTFEHNVFNSRGRKTFEAVRISRTVQANQEYHTVAHSYFNGWGDFEQFFSGGNIANGSTTFTYPAADRFRLGVSGTFSDSPDIGRRIRIALAKSGMGVVTTLDTTITAVTDARTATVATAATLPAVNVCFQLGENWGKAIVIGPSPNAKKIWIERNQINGFNYGILNLGSCQAVSNSFFDNDVNIGHAPSEPFIDIGSNTENSRKHIMSVDSNFLPALVFGSSTMPYIVDGIRFAVNQVEAGGAFFDLDGTPVSWRGGAWDDISALSGGAVVFRGDTNARFSFDAQRFNAGAVGEAYVRARLGFSRFTFHSFISATGQATQIHDMTMDTRRWFGGGTYFASNGESPTVFETLSSGGGTDPNHCWGAIFRSQPGASFGDWLGGIKILPPGDDAAYAGNLNNKRQRAIEIHLPNHSNGLHMIEAEGSRVLSPALTGGSTLGEARGHVIEPLKTTGVTKGTAMDQQGPNDLVKINGILAIGAKNAAPDDAEIALNQLTPYLDETGGAAKLRVRKSDGTYATVTLPFDV